MAWSLHAAGEADNASSSKPASPEKQESGIDAFPALEEETTTEVRVTGTQGLGEDPEREKFEAEFPDITTEVPSAAVSTMERGTEPQGDQRPVPLDGASSRLCYSFPSIS